MKSQALVKTANIVWARSQARLSRFELAKKLSVKEDRIEEWEKGESFPTFKQAQKLADSTHIPFFQYFFVDFLKFRYYVNPFFLINILIYEISYFYTKPITTFKSTFNKISW